MVVAASAAGACAEAPADAGQADAVERIGRYCDASWRNARIRRDEWADCTQDVFLRLLERCSLDGLDVAIEDPESSERRELNRSIWATAQRRRRAVRPAALHEASVPAEHTGENAARAELRTLLRSDCLSDRQRQILSMTADGWSVAEIAESLNLPAARVSDEKYKAVNRLARTHRNTVEAT
jgi:RNA polymerase sigma factor (sigma-70 family)